MLASLFRHVGRPVAAKEQLDHLVESSGSEKWNFEIFHERLKLARANRQGSDDSREPVELGESGIGTDSVTGSHEAA
jgi:hypothetical protein